MIREKDIVKKTQLTRIQYELAKRYIDCLNEGDIGTFQELLSDDIIEKLQDQVITLRANSERVSFEELLEANFSREQKKYEGLGEEPNVSHTVRHDKERHEYIYFLDKEQYGEMRTDTITYVYPIKLIVTPENQYKVGFLDF